MSTINQLSAASSLSAADLLVLYSSSNGDARKFALSVLQAYMQSSLDFNIGSISKTQYSAPSTTGFSVEITEGGTHLILTPTGTLAEGTLVLPPKSGLSDRQEVLVNCTQQVTSLLFDANGATAVTGAPTSISANGYFRLKYDAGTSTWYRVG
jgi:hypothetical protein